MITIDYKNTTIDVLGDEFGLDLKSEFSLYAPKIDEIIKTLNFNKDKQGSWLQWMNLGYNEETLWYVKEYAAMVEGRFDNVLVLGIGGSALGARAFCDALLPSYWNM